MMSLIDSIDGHVLERCFAWLDIRSLGRAGATCAAASAIALRGALWEPHCCALSALDPETLRALGAPGDGGWFGRAAEVASVLAAQERFYEAFAAHDRDRMAACWLPSAGARCVHPGCRPSHGFAAVMASWDAIFAAQRPSALMELLGRGSARANAIAPTRCVVHVSGDQASVALEEVPRRLVGRPDAQPIVATNVFVRAAGGAWKVSMHHASVIMR